MKKKLSIVCGSFIVGAIMMGASSNAMGKIHIQNEQGEITTGSSPYIVNGTTLVPLNIITKLNIDNLSAPIWNSKDVSVK